MNCYPINFKQPLNKVKKVLPALSVIANNNCDGFVTIIEIGSGCDETIVEIYTTILNKNLVSGKNVCIIPGGKVIVAPSVILKVNGELMNQ